MRDPLADWLGGRLGNLPAEVVIERVLLGHSRADVRYDCR